MGIHVCVLTFMCVCVPVCLRESKVTSPQTVSRPSTPELTLRITVTGGGSGGRWFAEMLLDLWTETSHSFGSDVSLLTSNFSYAIYIVYTHQLWVTDTDPICLKAPIFRRCACEDRLWRIIKCSFSYFQLNVENKSFSAGFNVGTGVIISPFGKPSQ